jgi:hypothetical protein
METSSYWSRDRKETMYIPGTGPTKPWLEGELQRLYFKTLREFKDLNEWNVIVSHNPIDFGYEWNIGNVDMLLDEPLGASTHDWKQISIATGCEKVCKAGNLAIAYHEISHSLQDEDLSVEPTRGEYHDCEYAADWFAFTAVKEYYGYIPDASFAYMLSYADHWSQTLSCHTHPSTVDRWAQLQTAGLIDSEAELRERLAS